MRVNKPDMILRLRRAYEAHRHAGLVFRAASEGQPLELQRRLALGKLAGGASNARIKPTGHRVKPPEAGIRKDCA